MFYHPAFVSACVCVCVFSKDLGTEAGLFPPTDPLQNDCDHHVFNNLILLDLN